MAINETPLRKLRLARKATLAEYAAKCGMDVSNYSKIERGEIKPRPETARRISLAFGRDITEHQLLYPEDYAEAAVA